MRVAFVAALLAASLAAQSVTSERHRLTAGAGVIESEAPFLAAGVRWTGSAPELELRASHDRANWSGWIPVRASNDSVNAALVFFGWDSRYLEVRNGPADIEVDLIDPGRTPPDRLNAIRDKSRDRHAWFKPPVISRIGWGCPDRDHAREPVQYTTVTHLIIHHTGDAFPTNDYPAWVRAIWQFHVFTNGWIDIGYNYLIDPDGTIYEGRAGGDNVLGAHFSCTNTGTMGVSLLGTFTSSLPSPAALDSLAALLAWNAEKLNLDPLGQSLHKASGLTLFNLASHRDGNTSPITCTRTECPGGAFYPTLAGVRNAVATRIAATAASLLEEDADRPASAWTASGLWHVTERRAFSDRRSWWYGREDTGTYETGDSFNHGTLESPPFKLDRPATLSFRSWFDTEDESIAWDRKLVELQVDGGEWRTLDELAGPRRVWMFKSYPINVTGTVRVRFSFNTVDPLQNAFEGWNIDDVRVN